MERMIVYISLILALVAIPTQSRGQYVRVEKAHQSLVAIIYAEGMPPTAIWELGRILRDEKTGATIRHTPDAGIDNINVNSKLPFRFIVAPTDTKWKTPFSDPTGLHDWAEAMGFGSEENSSLKAGTIAQVTKGCRGYSAGTVSGSGSQAGAFTGISGINNWRLPTQRELALMYLFRDAIDQAYINIFTVQESTAISRLDKLEGVYWSSTENDATSAYYFNFTVLDAHAAVKTAKCKVRCVADY